jgi:general secretion pathway protein L
MRPDTKIPTWPLRIEAFVRGWAADLLAVLPIWITAAVERDQTVLLRLSKAAPATAPSGHEASFCTELTSDAASVPEGLLWIDPQLVYTRRIDLPIARGADLRDALTFETQRYTPLPQDLVYTTFRVAERDFTEGRARVDLFIIRKATLDAAFATAANAGLVITRFCTDFDAHQILLGYAPNRTNLLARLSRRQRGFAARIAMTALLVALAIGSPMLRWHIAARQARHGLVVAQAAATAAEPQRRMLLALSNIVQAINQAGALPQPARLLNEIAAALPDDTWLSEFDVEGGQLRVHGYSSNAARLLDILARLQDLQSPKFTGPITRNSENGQEEFDIELELPHGT